MKTHFYLNDIVDICNLKHLSIDEIYFNLKKKYPNIAKASVYRNVEKLVKDGKINKVITNDKKIFYEKTIKPHIHLINQYGEIEDLYIDLSKLSIDIPRGFNPKKIDITIYGEKK